MHLTQKKSNPVHRLSEKITTWEEWYNLFIFNKISSGEAIPHGKNKGQVSAFNNDASIHPGAVDIANNLIDEDCDGVELDTLPAAKSPQLSVALN